MAVVAILSSLLTNIDAVPPVLPEPHQWRGPIIRSWARMKKSAGESTNSTYRAMRVHSSALIASCGLLTDAWGTSGSVDIGFYDVPAVNGGAIISSGQELGASIDVSAAITSKTELAGKAGQVAMTQRVWERLGLTSDPNKHYDIVVKAVNIGLSQDANFFVSLDVQR